MKDGLNFQGWEETRRRGFRTEKDYCWEYFLSPNTLQVTFWLLGAGEEEHVDGE